MRTHSPKTWWTVKGKITSRFGSVTACAIKLGCSPDALRKATTGHCPHVAEALKKEIDFDWDAPAPSETAAASLAV